MFRRLALIVVAAGALLGVVAVPLATPAQAVTQHVYSPVRTHLLLVCITVASAGQGLCIHL